MNKYIFSNIENDFNLNNSKIGDVKIEEYYNEVNEQSKTKKRILYKYDNNIIYFTFFQKEYIIEKKNINHISLFDQDNSILIILYNEDLKKLYQIQIDILIFLYLIFLFYL